MSSIKHDVFFTGKRHCVCEHFPSRHYMDGNDQYRLVVGVELEQRCAQFVFKCHNTVGRQSAFDRRGGCVQ